MTRPDSALVKVRPATVQPTADEDLYGVRAVPAGMMIPVVDSTGFYQLSVTPDPMCADVLHDVEIVTGVEGDLILWKDREEYEASLQTQTFYAAPAPITWDLRILVHVKGAQFMHSVEATVAGLAEGIWLDDLRHTSTACLHSLDGWKMQAYNDSISRLLTTVHTFGLPEGAVTRGETPTSIPPLRLNLRVLLRDEETVLWFHYDVIPEEVTLYEDELLVRIEIPIVMELPYVDAKGSTGFDATVTPWEPGGKADVNM